VNEKLTACTENLLAVADWERLAACAQEGCVLIPDFAGFFLDSVKIFAAADLAYVADGMLHVIDWKSGKRGDSDPTQVLLSAYCTSLDDSGPAGDREDPGGVTLRPVLHYLLDGTSLEPHVPHDLGRFVRDVVEPGIAAMRNLLLDPWENVPLPEEEFERRESGLCRRHCDFRPLCERS
jgi:hypothetical protein